MKAHGAGLRFREKGVEMCPLPHLGLGEGVFQDHEQSKPGVRTVEQDGERVETY